ncbi:MAG: response regulator [Acidobacteria bacterium]|nr:response regulator [Acidobacteriota bacterium]
MSSKVISWIEDDAEEIDVVVRPLLKAGFTIKPYRTYAEAMASLDEIRQSDLLLVDLVIPPGKEAKNRDEADDDISLGKILLKELRQAGLHMPAIVLSVIAKIGEITEAEAQELNCVLLEKPIFPRDLKKEVFKRLGLPLGD